MCTESLKDYGLCAVKYQIAYNFLITIAFVFTDGEHSPPSGTYIFQPYDIIELHHYTKKLAKIEFAQIN